MPPKTEEIDFTKEEILAAGRAVKNKRSRFYRQNVKRIKNGETPLSGDGLNEAERKLFNAHKNWLKKKSEATHPERLENRLNKEKLRQRILRYNKQSDSAEPSNRPPTHAIESSSLQQQLTPKQRRDQRVLLMRRKRKKRSLESAVTSSNAPAAPPVNSSTSPRTLSIVKPSPPNPDLLLIVKGIERSYGVFR